MKTPLTDLQLIEAVVAGDDSAFSELYERHHRRVYCICLRMTQNVEESEDLAQDVFVALTSKLQSFRGESAFTTWLHRLTVNQVLMHFRKPSVQRRRKLASLDDITVEQEPRTAPPEQQLIDRMLLERAVEQLPDGYRNTFLLHDVEGFEHEEVGRIMACTQGTSKSQLHKAHRKLKGLLKKNYLFQHLPTPA